MHADSRPPLSLAQVLLCGAAIVRAPAGVGPPAASS